MEKQTTFKQVIIFAKAGEKFLSRGDKKETETKLHQSVRSVLKQIRKDELLDDYNSRLEDVYIEHCSVDSNGNVIRNAQGGYVYSKESLRLVSAKEKEVIKSTVPIAVKIFEGNDDLASKLLSDEEKEIFSGLVINELTE